MELTLQSKKKMNDGNFIPIEALGVYKSADQTKKAVLDALKAGYRHIDTASFYHNEEEVGQAIRESGIDRKDIFVTTKVWVDDINAGRAKQSLEESLERLGLDYVDLYLIHWPVEGYLKAYKDMMELRQEGKVKTIGVSNFKKHHLETLISEVQEVPAVDQIEFNPLMQDDETLQFCNDNQIVLEAWAPLGRGNALSLDVVEEIAKKHEKTPAQVTLRWLIQKGIVILPKSVHNDRIIQNADLYDFELSEDEMKRMNALNEHKRTGPDPDTFTGM